MKLLFVGFFCLAFVVDFGELQIDTTFCDVSNINSDDGQNLPLPYRNNSEIYSALIEKNQQVTNAYGIEITEFFDGHDNAGIAIQRLLTATILSYTYVNYDEVLVIDSDGCKVYKEEEAYAFSPFQVVTDSQGRKHLASPLTIISQDFNVPKAYLGSTNRFVRGIAVREWQACAYSQTEQSTLKITISYSNKDKWQSPFHQVPGQESVPIQIRFDHKPTVPTRQPFTEIYSIMEFRTNDLVDMRQTSIPNGVYCKDRLRRKAWPALPTSFSFVSHIVAEDDLTGKTGVLVPWRFEYDTEKKLVRSDNYNEKKQLMTEIEDFAKGVAYVLNRYLGTCEVVLTDIQQPKDIFRLNEEPRPEYLGYHQVRGIHTEAWIAPRNFSNQMMLMEWHFMSERWSSIESNGVKRHEPVAIYAWYRNNNGQLARVEYQVSNFDSTRIDLYDFDVSTCHSIPNKHLRFTVTDGVYFELMRTNLRNFREAAFLAIEASTKVRVIRLSRLEIIFDGGVAYLTFTLLEKTELGVNLDEISLNDAYTNLADDIKASRLIIKFNDLKTNQEITVRADPNSLSEISMRNGRYIYNTVKGKTVGVSSGVVALLVILFLIIGLVGGLVAGVFIIIKRVINISLPGPLSFFNPNFSQEAA